jgi:hypothetical protein
MRIGGAHGRGGSRGPDIASALDDLGGRGVLDATIVFVREIVVVICCGIGGPNGRGPRARGSRPRRRRPFSRRCSRMVRVGGSRSAHWRSSSLSHYSRRRPRGT